MNLGQILTKARSRLYDSVTSQPLWTDEELTDFANQGEREAAERALLLEDDAEPTSAVITITQTAGLATATSVAHPFFDGQKLRISGADQAGYNLNVAIKRTSANVFTYPVVSSTVSPATGTIIAETLSGLLCNIDGAANTSQYALDSKIIEVKSVTWDGRMLSPISRAELNRGFSRGWKTATGTPNRFIDPQEKYLTLYPKPTVAGAIAIGVYRYPLTDMVRDGDVPEIAERHHFNVIDWIEYLAYSKEDTEVQDLPRADRAAKKFAINFGEKIDASTRHTQRDRSTNQVRMNPAW